MRLSWYVTSVSGKGKGLLCIHKEPLWLSWVWASFFCYWPIDWPNPLATENETNQNQSKWGHSYKIIWSFHSSKANLYWASTICRVSQVALVGKNPPANARDLRVVGWSLGRKIPRGGHGNSLQYFCLENPMDRGAWWATVHGVTKRQARLSTQHRHPCLASVPPHPHPPGAAQGWERQKSCEHTAILGWPAPSCCS